MISRRFPKTAESRNRRETALQEADFWASKTLKRPHSKGFPVSRQKLARSLLLNSPGRTKSHRGLAHYPWNKPKQLLYQLKARNYEGTSAIDFQVFLERGPNGRETLDRLTRRIGPEELTIRLRTPSHRLPCESSSYRRPSLSGREERSQKRSVRRPRNVDRRALAFLEWTSQIPSPLQARSTPEHRLPGWRSARH